MRTVNGSGFIGDGSELFGNATPSNAGGTVVNGYEALIEMDENGDSLFDHRDSHYASLRVWGDTNRNGISESDELRTLPQAGILAIELDYRESERRDAWGNRFRYRSKVRMATPPYERFCYDVFLVTRPR